MIPPRSPVIFSTFHSYKGAAPRPPQKISQKPATMTWTGATALRYLQNLILQCADCIPTGPIIDNPSWAATFVRPDGGVVLFSNPCCPFSFSMTVPAPLASKFCRQFSELTGQEAGASTFLFALHYRGCSRMQVECSRTRLPSAVGWGLIGAAIPH